MSAYFSKKNMTKYILIYKDVCIKAIKGESNPGGVGEA